MRVVDPSWSDPIDTSYSVASGGRWNPQGAWARLYLSYEIDTGRLQIQRMLEGTPFEPDDLADDAYDLITVNLPDQQTALRCRRRRHRGGRRPSEPPSPHRPATGSRTRRVGPSRPHPNVARAPRVLSRSRAQQTGAFDECRAPATVVDAGAPTESTRRVLPSVITVGGGDIVNIASVGRPVRRRQRRCGPQQRARMHSSG